MLLYEHGWTGKILRVDLTERKWNVESTSKYADRFIGGIGIGLKILWDEVDPEINSFNPGNKLSEGLCRKRYLYDAKKIT